jgi:integron integrase
MKTEEAVQNLIGVCRRQHKALETERSYAGWLRRYCRFIIERRPLGGSIQRVEAFLTQLAKQDVSASTQNQAFNALVFFYKDVLEEPLGNVDALRATRPASLRHAPTVQETADLLRNVRDVAGYPTRLIVRLLYGCGLRVSEPLNLRVKDLNFDDSQVFILGAKGGKDRVVALPCSVVDDLREQMVYARTIWQRDRTMKIPVEMPHQLAAKYPEYQFSWPWAWVFPSHQPCRHPRTGAIVRYRMHEANVQRAVKEARRKLGIAVTPHELRHAYATHNLNRGVNIKALSQAMGHAQIETTSGYCHAEALSVPSPLEMMA